MDADDRRRLRTHLAARVPLLTDPDLGPSSVDAGECDRCGLEARLVATCGPVPWAALGRRCSLELGTDAWCDGHREDAESALARLALLDRTIDDVVRRWWVLTGEVRLPD